METLGNSMEMNMHMPQNVLAETELRHLAAIPYQIISPASNGPIIGIYQDSLLGSYRLTRPNITFSPREAMNLLMMYSKVDTKALRDAGKKITSFEVLSQILAPITLNYKTNMFGDNEDFATSNNVLEIRNGKFIRGQLEKSVLGSTSKGILHRIFNDFGNMACSNFIDDLQNVVIEYMKSSSYSVGVSDLIADKTTQKKILQAIAKQKLEVQSLIDKVHLGIFENNTASANMVEFEVQVNNILNKARDESGRVARDSLSPENRFLMIVKSGSKGNMLNISQMISGLGQQNVDGKRIPYGFENRTLPHYNKYDDSPTARGFVENSYISGLTAPELFFHAMGGRIGLIDTACKTATTGYIQRRLIKGLEDLKVEYDMTVRNHMGRVVQFAYGDDGIDTTRVENQTIPLVGMSIEDIYMHFDLASPITEIYTKDAARRMKSQTKDAQEKCMKYINKMIENRKVIVESVFKNKNEDIVKMPVSFANSISNIQGQLSLNANSIVDITPLEAFNLIEKYYGILQSIVMVKPGKLFEVMYYYYLSPKNLLIHKRFHEKALTMLLEMIVLKYKQSIVHPGEMVGVIAGQSIGEPTTQMTLNSVTYETLILVRDKDKNVEKISIGDFTMREKDRSPKIDYTATNDTTYAELRDFYEIPSCTEAGEIVWRRIEAVTKHPVVNLDGTNTMLKVTTGEEREVTATKAKSFLKLVDGKVIPVSGDSLKVGDYVPVSLMPIEFNETKQLDLRDILSPSEYIYSSEVEKAKLVMNERNWWANHNGKTFTLPYTRGDSFKARVNDKVREGRMSKTGFDSNCVYTKHANPNRYKVPEQIDMTYNFGYLVGAYASEGCMTRFQMSIANNDEAYFKPILELCQEWNLTTKVYKHENKCQEGWTSQDLRIYNTVLCRILDKLCGKLSHNKFISDKIIFSNKECLLGFMDAYIGGDGSVSKKSKTISMSSVSKQLIMDVQQMLNCLGVYSHVYKPPKQVSNNRGTLPENIHQPYMLNVCGEQNKKLASMLNIKIQSKQDMLVAIMNHDFTFDIHKNATIIPNEIDGTIVIEQRTPDKYSTLLFDVIKTIEEVPNTTDYAYDLTIEDTRTFVTYNGAALMDTFHLAGISSKSNVTRGVPRIEELLRLTNNPKNPSLTIHLKPLDETDRDKAIKYANMLEYTKLADLVKSMQICFDPNERSTFLEHDKKLLEQFYEFEDLITECNGGVTEAVRANKSKWIIRMEMDAEILLEKNITMDDVNYAISNSAYGENVSCVFADYNNDKLVFRIRVFDINKKKKIVANTLDQSDEIYALKNMQDVILNSIVLRGIVKIEKATPRKLQNMVYLEEGKFSRKDVWVLDTTGSNLISILGLDFIDVARTYSNDIREVCDVLGIEAARQMLFNEITEVMEFSDAYINYHHLSLLCDRMTMTKNMVPIFRSGILNDAIGPIAKATFEVHTEVLLNAARHADFDSMRGVSASVMCGQYGKYGTGAFNVILDMKEMAKLSDVVANQTSNIEKMFGVGEDKSDGCSTNAIRIRNNITNIKAADANACDDDYNMGFM
jgi:DNA-directed RNA polymerase beta' subunit